MNRPRIIVLTSASLDGRLALGPNRTQKEEMADPRNQITEETGKFWAEVEHKIDQIHSPQAKMQGSGSFPKEG